MKPLREWSNRGRAALTVALVVPIGLLAFGVLATEPEGPSEADQARYARVRAECTDAADAIGFVGRARVDAINDCMTNRY